jgi:hypothetical protein
MRSPLVNPASSKPSRHIRPLGFTMGSHPLSVLVFFFSPNAAIPDGHLAPFSMDPCLIDGIAHSTMQKKKTSEHSRVVGCW